MSSPEGSQRRYVQPQWPEDEPFILEMLGPGGGHILGPCSASDWTDNGEGNGAIVGCAIEGEKPIVLRIRSQERPEGGPLILYANDGSISDMDYAVWTHDEWAKAHPGEEFDWP